MATDTIEFRASDLIGPAGSGSNGEKLVNMLLDHYPPELQAALEKRINRQLDAELDDKARGRIAKIAGVEEIEQAHVRGGARRHDQAVVTYAWLDDTGQVWKGCFPYDDLAGGSSDAHVSQRDSLAKSAIAKQHLQENPRAATPEADPVEQVDPIDALLSASADDLVAQMKAHPERAEAIKAFETATRGSKARKSVLDWQPDPPSGS